MQAVYHWFNGVNYDVPPFNLISGAAAGLAVYSWVKQTRKWHSHSRQKTKIAEFLTNWAEEMQEYAFTYCLMDVIDLVIYTFWEVSARINIRSKPSKEIGQSFKEILQEGKLVKNLEIFWMND